MDNQTERRLAGWTKWRFGALCGIPAGLTLFFAYRFAYDTDIAYFKTGSALFAAACALLAVGLFCAVILWGSARKRVSLNAAPKNGRAETFAALLAGVLFLLSAVRGTLAFDSPGKLEIAATILLVLPAAYLLCNGLAPERTAPAAIWLAFGGAVSAIVQLFYQYFRATLPLNAPSRHLETIATVGMLFFFLTESRDRIGTGYATASFYAFANGAAATVCTAVGLAHAMLSLTGGALTPDFAPDPFWCAALFAVGVLATCRVLRLPGLLCPYQPPYSPAEEEKKKKEQKALAKAQAENGGSTEANVDTDSTSSGSDDCRDCRDCNDNANSDENRA